jgi:hypothetical protein
VIGQTHLIDVVGALLEHLAEHDITAVGPLISSGNVAGGVIVAPPRISSDPNWADGDGSVWTVDVLVVGTGQDQSQVAELLRRADEILTALGDPDSPVYVTSGNGVVTGDGTPAYQITCQH